MLVIVFEVWPVGTVSRTETGSAKRAFRYANLTFADILNPTERNESIEKYANIYLAMKRYTRYNLSPPQQSVTMK